MKRIFRRLTIVYWLLFICVYCGFLVNFTERYQDVYEQTLEESALQTQIDTHVLQLAVTEFETSVAHNLRVFQTMYDHYHENYNLINSDILDLVLPEFGISKLEHLTYEEKVELYTLLKVKELMNVMLEGVNEEYRFSLADESAYLKKIFYFPYSSNKTVKQHLLSEAEIKFTEFINSNHETLISSNYSNEETSFYSYIYEDKNSGISYSIMSIDVTDKNEKFGSFVYVTDLGENSVVVGPNSNIHITRLTQNSNGDVINEDIDKEIEDIFRKYPTQTAQSILEDKGYISYALVGERQDSEMVYYFSKDKFETYIFKETFDIFEFNLLILITLFLIISYCVFIAIINPAYALIDYVKQCSQGNYDMPKIMMKDWRKIFIIVRDAYLENEQLLAVKEKQSQELEYAWKRALVANQAKTQFLAKVSHELRTPLNAIKGYVQLLKLSLTEPKHLRQLDIIESSSSLLLSVVNELLDFSRIEEGKINIQSHAIELSKISNAIENMFINQIETDEVSFKVMFDPRIPKIVYGDENKIKQILINLISNAIKFTNYGKIDVLIYLDFIDKEHAYIIFKVEDTGKGIAADKLDVIFDSFAQENNSISRKYGGTGLGLSIVKSLVEAMGGTITVESEKYVGSIFTVLLPLSIQPSKDKQAGD